MSAEEFMQKPLRVHTLLAGIPIRTLERTELPGGREGMMLQEISDVVGFGGEVAMRVGPVTRALFWLRTLIGRVLHWDEAPELVVPLSYVSQLTEDDIARSLVTPLRNSITGASRIDSERIEKCPLDMVTSLRKS